MSLAEIHAHRLLKLKAAEGKTLPLTTTHTFFPFVFVFFSHRMLLSSLFVGIQKSGKEIPLLLYNVTPRDLCLVRKSPYSVLLLIICAFCSSYGTSRGKAEDGSPRFHKQLRD